MQDPPQTQCIQVSPISFVIAVPDGRSWFTTVGASQVIALPVSRVAAERSTLAGSLVEGAISAGLVGIEQASEAGPYTLHRYIRWLAGNYVFAGQTPGLFRLGAERLDASGRRDLAALALQKAAEETGHADLAYRDLEALGLPAAEVVRLIQPPSANAFAERFRACVESSEPIALFGFSYCLERMAVERDRAFIRSVETVCPPGILACRFLKVHSTVGSDRAHVYEQLALFESLASAELTTVASTAYETAVMLAQQPRLDQTLSDEEVARRLRAAGIGFASAPPDRHDGKTAAEGGRAAVALGRDRGRRECDGDSLAWSAEVESTGRT